MAISFKTYHSLILIFDLSLTKVLLKNTNDKYDGFLYLNDNKKIEEAELCKKLFIDTNIEINPKDLRIVTSLQNIYKEYHINIFMTIANLENTINTKQDLIIMNTNEISNQCHPNLKWLIPLSNDVSVYGSRFNQILMK